MELKNKERGDILEKQKIRLKDIPEIFNIEKRMGKFRLSVGSARPFEIKIPFELDIELARVCGMLLDGYIDKNLGRVSFCQGKDRKKVTEFGNILRNAFGVKPRYSVKGNCGIVVVGSKSLSSFLHFCLDFHKSDEDARVPAWIIKSDMKIIKEYLRYAFAMEGSVSDPTKGDKEIKFHSCDKSFLVQLSGVLLRKFGIESYLQTYSVEGYGKKYYISITHKKNIFKFNKIGFALDTHQERLRKVVKSYKNRAWEITITIISRINKQSFSITDVYKKLPYITRRAVYQRLEDLSEMGLIVLSCHSYSLTRRGRKAINRLRGKVEVTKLRTNPRENEKIVMCYLSMNEACISQVARDLDIHVKTARDVIRRLVKFGRVRLSKIDEFQRKIYMAEKGR